ncbi:MAG: helix-turn-helix domain-containing protein [Myxococcales bacterium]|nr:helix-turn-helix domain-containing protein [Myxococcales bacterium]
MGDRDRLSAPLRPRQSASLLRPYEQTPTRLSLEHTGGNIGRAAELLKVSRRTVYNWMERYGVPRG